MRQRDDFSLKPLGWSPWFGPQAPYIQFNTAGDLDGDSQWSIVDHPVLGRALQHSSGFWTVEGALLFKNASGDGEVSFDFYHEHDGTPVNAYDIRAYLRAGNGGYIRLWINRFSSNINITVVKGGATVFSEVYSRGNIYFSRTLHRCNFRVEKNLITAQLLQGDEEIWAIQLHVPDLVDAEGNPAWHGKPGFGAWGGFYATEKMLFPLVEFWDGEPESYPVSLPGGWDTRPGPKGKIARYLKGNNQSDARKTGGSNGGSANANTILSDDGEDIWLAEDGSPIFFD